jgi:hypothetical protein
MTLHTPHIQLNFERRLLEHPAAYHLRRMRMASGSIFSLTRLPAGQDTLEVNPVRDRAFIIPGHGGRLGHP